MFRLVLLVAGPAVGDDAVDLFGVVVAAVDEPVLDADLLERAVQDQAADRPPALRTGMGPEHDALAGERKVAERADQVSGPDPRPGEQDQGIHVVHLLELGKALPRFLL